MKVELVTKGQNWGGDLPFYFNLSQPVGRGRPNDPADVGFVQFCLAVMSKTAAELTSSPETLPIFAKVRVTRAMDPATQEAIDAYLASRRTYLKTIVADGIIHAVPRGVTTNYAKDAAYAIVHLNFIMLHANKSIWPRLDLHQLAGPVAGDIRAAISPALSA